MKVGTTNRIYDHLFSTSAMTAALSGEFFIEKMLLFEIALAAALEEQGVIPRGTSAVLSSLSLNDFDLAVLAEAVPTGGNICIPFVKMLTAAVARIDEPASGYVHWGATSQDVIDSATMLQVRDALCLIQNDLDLVCTSLATLVQAHRHTVLPGRTWLQQGPPVTLGFKLATTLDALGRHQVRLRRISKSAVALQFGGAVGTLAPLGQAGSAVSLSLGRILNLPVPTIPWHTQRDRIGEIASTLGLLVGTLGKFGRDISLLMQTEIAELLEPSAPGRGGSSTMPHKRNPVFSAVLLAASTRVPAFVGTLFSSMVQEHERGLGGWQAEWETLSEIFRLTAGAVDATWQIVSGLEVDPAAIERDLELLGGVTMAEAIAFQLARKIGKSEAHRVVEAASRRAIAERIGMQSALCQEPALVQYFSPADFAAMLKPANYLGASDEFIEQVLAEHAGGLKEMANGAD